MKKIKLSLHDRSYSIYVAKGLIKDLSKYTNSVFTGRRLLVVSDMTVGRIYGRDCLQSLKKGGKIAEMIKSLLEKKASQSNS